MNRSAQVKILMGLFPVFFYSCMTSAIKTESVRGVPPEKFYNSGVLSVRMQSGEVYTFSKKKPARVVEDKIKGHPLVWEQIAIDQLKEITRDAAGNILSIIDQNGTTRKPVMGKIENSILGAFFDEASVPDVSLLYWQVEQISYKRLGFSSAQVALTVLLVVAAVVVGTFIIIANRTGEL